ncbi:MAG TPA: DEAD/DEAH box helicase [Solirubrobacterales bacterium]|jgi:SNF2 family DNA or RNA helicase|nr:DEAD/DEAH box helicase [Solirubrobacterales bacterium]
MRDLLPFQVRDIGKLLAMDNGANFSVPGAGKTTVELAIYEAERLAGRVEQLLVVAPLSGFNAWIEEGALCLSPPPRIHLYSGSVVPSDTELLLVNYQRLMISYEAIAEWVSARSTLVVLDEAHRMKRGRDGEWGKACLDLAFLAGRRDVLTGTPAPQHPADLVALLDFLWPGQAMRILPEAALVAHPAPTDVARVTEEIAPLFVRTTKAELRLREPIKQVLTIALDDLHRQIYESLRLRFSELARTQRERVELSAWASTVMYLLEAATNPALLPAGSSSGDPIEFRHPPLPIPSDSSLHDLIAEYAQYETPAKFVQLAALIDRLRAKGRKVLVWSNFIRNLETLERMLAFHRPALVHGGIPSEVTQPNALRARERELNRFRSDPECGVLLANPAALGEGVSLHHVCHDAVYLERTFNAGQYLQSVDRIHRLGLAADAETTIHLLVSEGTIDEAVSDRIEVKAGNLGVMLDDPAIATMALPDDEDVGQPIDVGDVAALFEHLRGDSDVG